MICQGLRKRPSIFRVFQKDKGEFYMQDEQDVKNTKKYAKKKNKSEKIIMTMTMQVL